MPSIALALLLLAISPAAAAAPKYGAPLPIDPTFNGGQALKVTLPTVNPTDRGIDNTRDVAVLTSGRILLNGEDGVLAFDADGSRAKDFGAGGIGAIDLSNTKLQGQAISDFQVDSIEGTPDGGFLALGVANSRTRMFFPIVSKYDSAGHLDATFGKGGYAMLRHSGGGTDINGSGQSSRLAVSSTGEIAVATEEGLKPENGLTVSLLSPTGRLRRSYGTRGVAGLGYRLNAGWPNEIGGVTFDQKGRIVLTAFIGDLIGCTDADPDLCIPSYKGQPIQFVARLDREGNPDRSFSGDGYTEPKHGTISCPTIGIKVSSTDAIYMANECGYVHRISDSGKQVVSFSGKARFAYPTWATRQVGDELLHIDSGGRISFAAWQNTSPNKQLVALVLERVGRTGVDRSSASARTLAGNKFAIPRGDIGRPFSLEYDSADNPVIASVRNETGTRRATVYLARFARR